MSTIYIQPNLCTCPDMKMFRAYGLHKPTDTQIHILVTNFSYVAGRATYVWETYIVGIVRAFSFFFFARRKIGLTQRDAVRGARTKLNELYE